MNSKEKLALALAESNAPGYMIERAKSGYYSDFDSDLEMPCVQLVLDCQKLDLSDIADRAKNGEFDATKQESDEWFEKEGKELFEQMGIDPPKMKEEE